MQERIESADAPAAIGPYSQATRVGDFLFISGMMPIIPQTGELAPATITDQTKQVVRNIDSVLRHAGFDAEDVVKTTCFLSDIADFSGFNEVYGAFFTGKPARSCIAVRGLPKGALVEVEVIAHRNH